MRIDVNVIKKNNKGEEFYDKFAIVQIVADVVLGAETSCSMLESGIMNDCTCCHFKNICKKSDHTINEMKTASTVVHEEFRFE